MFAGEMSSFSSRQPLLSLALALLASPGAGTRGDAPAGGAAAAAPGAPPTPGASGVAPGGARESFFAGAIPAEVAMRATKSFAIGPGVLLFQPPTGWSGGQLPGYDYMSASKEQSAVFRVATSTGVTAEMGCAQLATAAGMAPARIKNLKQATEAKVTSVGRNGFPAKEGSCTGDGPKGPVEVHYLDIARVDRDGTWHYAVLVSFPADASADIKNEARAFARTLEFTGKSGYSL